MDNNIEARGVGEECYLIMCKVIFTTRSKSRVYFTDVPTSFVQDCIFTHIQKNEENEKRRSYAFLIWKVLIERHYLIAN